MYLCHTVVSLFFFSKMALATTSYIPSSVKLGENNHLVVPLANGVLTSTALSNLAMLYRLSDEQKTIIQAEVAAATTATTIPVVTAFSAATTQQASIVNNDAPSPSSESKKKKEGANNEKIEILDQQQYAKKPTSLAQVVGASAQTLFAVMSGLRTVLDAPTTYHPHDVDDWERCRAVLQWYPEWRADLSKMKSVHGWIHLIDNWDTIDKLYLEDIATHGDKAYGLGKADALIRHPTQHLPWRGASPLHPPSFFFFFGVNPDWLIQLSSNYRTLRPMFACNFYFSFFFFALVGPNCVLFHDRQRHLHIAFVCHRGVSHLTPMKCMQFVWCVHSIQKWLAFVFCGYLHASLGGARNACINHSKYFAKKKFLHKTPTWEHKNQTNTIKQT